MLAKQQAAAGLGDRHREAPRRLAKLIEVAVPDLADQRLELLRATAQIDDLEHAVEIDRRADVAKPLRVLGDRIERLHARRQRWIAHEQITERRAHGRGIRRAAHHELPRRRPRAAVHLARHRDAALVDVVERIRQGRHRRIATPAIVVGRLGLARDRERTDEDRRERAPRAGERDLEPQKPVQRHRRHVERGDDRDRAAADHDRRHHAARDRRHDRALREPARHAKPPAADDVTRADLAARRGRHDHEREERDEKRADDRVAGDPVVTGERDRGEVAVDRHARTGVDREVDEEREKAACQEVAPDRLPHATARRYQLARSLAATRLPPLLWPSRASRVPVRFASGNRFAVLVNCPADACHRARDGSARGSTSRWRPAASAAPRSAT